MSVILDATDFKAYQRCVGPERQRPKRPESCPFCDWSRVWFNGWRLVFAVVLDDGHPHRFDEGLAVQRVKCERCARSWTLRPAFLYPHRSLQPDAVESAAFAYLSDEQMTYERVACFFRMLRTIGVALGGLDCGLAGRTRVARASRAAYPQRPVRKPDPS